MTLGLQPRGLLMYRAADLVQDVLGFDDCAKVRCCR